MSWPTEAMLGFDCESDGPNPSEAHLITAAVAVRGGTVPPRTLYWTAVPRRPIPAEATQVHSITTDTATRDGAPIETVLTCIVTELAWAWNTGIPVCGKNIGFDLTLVAHELARHGLPGLVISGSVLDAQIIDGAVDRYRRGSRKLDALCAHYRVPLTTAGPRESGGAGAHNALADVLGTLRVLWRMGTTVRVPSYSDPRRRRLQDIPLPELHDLQVDWALVRAASLQAYFDRTGKQVTVDGSWPVRPVSFPAAVLA